jgi:predicted nuclease of predicted toxin-antitoxin system
MKFLVDVNASGAIVTLLKVLGHDVAQVVAIDERMSDDAILQWALTEGRIILTTDQDFEEMIWRERRAHYGVLRLENLPRAARRALLEETLAHHGQALEAGAIVIATTRKVRVRWPFR